MFSPCVPTLISSSYFCILHETNINCAIWFEAFLSFVLWLVWILSEVPFLLSVVSPFHCKLCSFSCLWLGLVVNGLGKVASIYFTWAVNFTQLCTQLNSIIKQIYMFTKLVLLHRHLRHRRLVWKTNCIQTLPPSFFVSSFILFEDYLVFLCFYFSFLSLCFLPKEYQIRNLTPGFFKREARPSQTIHYTTTLAFCKPTPSLSLSLSLNIFSISGCKICHILNHVSTLSLFQPFSLTYTWNA